MKNPNHPKMEVNSENRNRTDTFDSIKEFSIYNEISSKSLLANVIDEKTRNFVLNDDFGIIRSKLCSSF